MSTATIKPASAALQLDAQESQFRRLFKARHSDMNKMEIRTSSLSATMEHDSNHAFTVYTLEIRSKVRCGDSGAWFLAKRYSEFFTFRKKMLKMIRHWETTLDEGRKASTEFALISNSLRRPITPDFPRKHMRCDTKAIVQERRYGLQEFVRKLLDAYADISVYLFNSQPNDSGSYANLRAIYVELEDFLDVPQEQKEIENRQTAAVLALQDVDPIDHMDEHGHRTRSCCICLDDIDDANAIDNDHTGDSRLVRLPCNHTFHEDCVIDWFNASLTCPLCRRNAAVEPLHPTVVAFDVSIH